MVKLGKKWGLWQHLFLLLWCFLVCGLFLHQVRSSKINWLNFLRRFLDRLFLLWKFLTFQHIVHFVGSNLLLLWCLRRRSVCGIYLAFRHQTMINSSHSPIGLGPTDGILLLLELLESDRGLAFVLDQVLQIFILHLLPRLLWVLIIDFLHNATALQLILTRVVDVTAALEVTWLNATLTEVHCRVQVATILLSFHIFSN
jgi:hypothetical protein